MGGRRVDARVERRLRYEWRVRWMAADGTDVAGCESTMEAITLVSYRPHFGFRLDLNLSLLKTTKTATKKKTLFLPPQARMKRRKGVK